MDAQPSRKGKRGEPVKKAITTGLLIAIAVFGPMVAFAGISVIWPTSTLAVDVSTDVPILFAPGSDHAQAETLGFASAFTAKNSGASYELTVSGISGGTLIIDDLVSVTANLEVASYEIEIGSALAGTLAPIDELKIRLWTGAVPPTADDDAQVCGVLDLLAAQGTLSGACTESAQIQVIVALGDDADGTATVGIRPTSIVFA